MKPRPNIESDNPHPPGTILAGQYDLKMAVRRLGTSVKRQACIDRDRIFGLLARKR